MLKQWIEISVYFTLMTKTLIKYLKKTDSILMEILNYRYYYFRKA